MNTTEIIALFDFGSKPIVGTIAIYCLTPIRVHISPFTGNKLSHVISYVQFSNCNVSVSDWNYISATTDMRVFGSINNNYETSSPCEEHNSTYQCTGLQSAVSFSYENNQINAPDFADILSCLDVFPNMAEVSFSNMSWTRLPRVIGDKFPNLQALELSRNNITLPPIEFPWKDEAVTLPRNLSRTAYMDNHYSKSGILNLLIKPNVYRRMFNLNHNQIQDLSNFSFHGYLHIIMLKGNQIVEIGDNTFQNVTGLQHIDLSENRLTTLHVHIFRGLTHMRHLDVSENRLTTVEVGIFHDLESLIFLNIANNSLTRLDIGVFSRLRQLEVIHLEHNNLATLTHDSFPVDSLVLKYVYLNNNPLTVIPEFLFWLRGLEKADLHSTNISFRNFTDYLIGLDSSRVAYSIIDSGSDSDLTDLLKRSQTLRTIDLSWCQIESITFRTDSEISKLGVPTGPLARLTLQVLLLHFKFILTGNPIKCNCEILPVSNLISELKANGTVMPNEYYFTDWTCQSPSELSNRPLLSVRPEETYCQANIHGCPRECQCYRRSVNNNTIVDCRNRNLDNIHDTMPISGPKSNTRLELWYSGNNITNLPVRRYLSHVSTLDLSNNRINSINAKVFGHLYNLKSLLLHSNLLAYLPEYIGKLKLTNLTIDHNPYHCDCHSLWMKRWITSGSSVIANWNKITCNNQEVGKEIIKVPDEKFVCKEVYDSLRHVVLPSLTCSVLLVIMLAFMVAMYAYRLECKVLLYIYLGVHPFDKDADNEGETIDCVIVHSGALTNWVMNQIVDILEGENYNFVVCDVARDFVLGYSFQENLTQMVQRSKRMIFCVSTDWEPANENFKLTWNIAQEKIKETKSHYGIIVSHGLSADNIEDKDLKLFMSRGRFIDASKRLFLEKLVYSMPPQTIARHIPRASLDRTNFAGVVELKSFKKKIPSCFIEHTEEIGVDDYHNHVFVSYADEDIHYLIQFLLPLLENNGYKTCIADRDFIPGAAKDENILGAIATSMRTIFLLSEAHVKDEWSLFTFRAACEKSLREKTNHLIVITIDDIALENTCEEIRHYMKSYISVHAGDRWFEQKLFNGLPLLKCRKELHTSPLFIGEDLIDTEDMTIWAEKERRPSERL